MDEQFDPVAHYARSKRMVIKYRTVLVEGDSDVRLMNLAARYEADSSGASLIGHDMAIVSAGYGEDGGCSGVVRELVVLRQLALTYLFPNGKPRYRFIALFDNDRAGREAVRNARYIDTSLLDIKFVKAN